MAYDQENLGLADEYMRMVNNRFFQGNAPSWIDTFEANNCFSHSCTKHLARASHPGAHRVWPVLENGPSPWTFGSPANGLLHDGLVDDLRQSYRSMLSWMAAATLPPELRRPPNEFTTFMYPLFPLEPPTSMYDLQTS